MKRVCLLILVILIFLLYACKQKQNEILDEDTIQKKEVFHYNDQISPDVMKKEIEFFSNHLIDIHPAEIMKDIINNSFHKLSQELEEPLSIGDYALKLMKIVAELNDSHTLIYPENIKSDRLPIEFEWLEDGIFVSKSEDNRIMVGDELLSAGDLKVKEILQFMRSIIPAENDHVLRLRASSFLQQEYILRAMSVLNEGSVSLRLKRDHDTFLSNIDLQPTTTFNQNDKDSADWYSWRIDHKYNTGYFKLSSSDINDKFENEVRQFFEEVENEGIERILIDVRENSGGNSNVLIPFMEHLPVQQFNTFGATIKYSKTANSQRGYNDKTYDIEIVEKQTIKNNHRSPLYHGKVYVLTGPNTYSSGAMFAVQLHDSELATIIGEPTGGKPSSYGDIVIINLPFSNIPVTISHKKFNRPQESYDPIDALYPHIMIERTKKNIISKEDLQLIEAMEMIQD